jgi:hypothetical protein
MAFVVLCKGYLGIELHFELWRYFFSVSLHKKVEKEKRKKEYKVSIPSSGESGGAVHVHPIDDVQQSMAQAMVLLEE